MGSDGRRELGLAPRGGGFLKRAVDVAGSGALLLAALPVLVGCALAVRLTSRGAAFFGHRRLGRGGRTFRCWKLRTMTPDAEARLENDPELHERYRNHGYKLPTNSDPRVTRVGAILRRTYLDELPQLWNVLRGDMSLVGPRPIVEEELRHYGDRAAALLSVKPGIFGPWTVHGRGRPDYPERTGIELSYVGDRSLGRDLRILFGHVSVLLRGQEDAEA